MPEAILMRYLSVFLPWCATVVVGHLILRTSASPLVAASGLASPRLLARVLGASAIAIVVIGATDLVTAGDLFLAPRFPGSALLLAVILVTAGVAGMAARFLGSIERLRRRP